MATHGGLCCLTGTNFSQFVFDKIIKIVTTRCQITYQHPWPRGP